MAVDRRRLQVDAEWVRKICAGGCGLLGFLVCFMAMWARTDGHFGVVAFLVCLGGWYFMTRLGDAIGRHIAHIMLGVAREKYEQEMLAIHQRAAEEQMERSKGEEQVQTVTPEMLSVGMKTASAVTAPDGRQIVPSGRTLTQEDILNILQTNIASVDVMGKVERG